MRQQAREIAGQLRQSVPPRPRGNPRGGSQARTAHPPPRVTVTLPAPQPDRSAYRGRRGRGRRGRGRGHNTPQPAAGQGPRGLLTPFPERWGPRLRWAAASRRSTLAWAAITDDAYVLSIVRSGLVVELSEPLPGGVIRMPTPRMPPHVRAGMAAEITALLNKGVIEPMADHLRLCLSLVFFSSPSARGIFA